MTCKFGWMRIFVSMWHNLEAFKLVPFIQQRYEHWNKFHRKNQIDLYSFGWSQHTSKPSDVNCTFDQGPSDLELPLDSLRASYLRNTSIVSKPVINNFKPLQSLGYEQTCCCVGLLSSKQNLRDSFPLFPAALIALSISGLTCWIPRSFHQLSCFP